MLMTNESIELYPHDRILAWTLVPITPKFVRPNHLTILRVLLVPFVLAALWYEVWPWALGLFVFAAITDAWDGSLARLRKQITLWGTMADPAADKLLIGSVMVLFVAREINVIFAVTILVIELMLIGGAYIRKRQGRYASANNYGKLKMFLQVVGVSILLVAKLMGVDTYVPYAIGTLSLAIVLAVVSLITYTP
ncbi:CDP-alcohol phosphatidyltransferase family protein [Candidatus Uhrbacteria bacterium]|nr:CDP-alcohol phosphatidyltransferase family protein [Candidatus Uhrbacteria bacterium]